MDKQNKKINIGIDFDGTITDYYGFQSQWILENYDLKIINPSATLFEDRFGISEKKLGYSQNDYFDIYFKEVKPKNGVKETIDYLISNGFNIYIITNRSELRRQYIKNYLNNHKIKYNELYCLNRSNQISKLDKLLKLNINIMIEDHPHQIKSISKSIKTICIDDKYNQNIVGKNILHVKRWPEIVKIIPSFKNC